MSTDGSVQTAEGSSRKRLKISRTAGRPVGTTLLDPIAIKSDSPAKVAITDDAQPKEETSQQNCHHEQSLRKLHTDLDDMRHIITCKVCQRFLYEPYTLTCGHTFCYSCLSQWMGQNHKKTCPDCRTIVREQPTPAYLIKEMVFIFVKRSELLPDGETSEEHYQMANEEAEIVTRDKANVDDSKGGLFMGAFKRSLRRPLQAIHDPSDHVDRCPQCLHEVEDGHCNNCNVRVRTEFDDSDYMSSDSGEDGEEEEESDVDHELAQDHPGYVGYQYPDSDATLDDDEIRPGPDGYITAADMQELRNQGYSTPPNGGYSSDDDEEDPEMEGFIDDDVVQYDTGEDNLSDASVQEQAAPRRQRRNAPVVLSDDDDEDDDVQVQVPNRRRLVTRRPARQSPVEIIGDSSNSDSDNEPVQRNSQRPRGRVPRAVSISSSEESSDDGEDDGATPRRHNFPPVDDEEEEMQRAMHNSIHPDSDESDDNSDDQSEVVQGEGEEDSDGSDESDEQTTTDASPRRHRDPANSPQRSRPNASRPLPHDPHRLRINQQRRPRYRGPFEFLPIPDGYPLGIEYGEHYRYPLPPQMYSPASLRRYFGEIPHTDPPHPSLDPETPSRRRAWYEETRRATAARHAAPAHPFQLDNTLAAINSRRNRLSHGNVGLRVR